MQESSTFLPGVEHTCVEIRGRHYFVHVKWHRTLFFHAILLDISIVSFDFGNKRDELEINFSLVYLCHSDQLSNICLLSIEVVQNVQYQISSSSNQIQIQYY